MTEFHNQEELNKALNIYRHAMCDFIFEYLRRKVRGETAEDLIRRVVNREPSNLEPKHISRIFGHPECRNLFKQRFGYSQVDDRDKYDIKSVTALITMGRNIVSHHAGTTDLDSEFTRTCLFLITDILREINRPDAKEAVETIRDRLFSDESEEHPLEAENAALKKDLADMTKQLEAAEAEKAELEKLLKDKSDRLEEMEAERTTYKKRLETASFRVKITEAGKTVAEERLSDISNRFEEAEVEKAELEKRLETTLAQLEEVEDKLDDCNEELDRTRRQLKELIDPEPPPLNSNTPDSVTFQGTTFTKHLNEYYVTGDDISQGFWYYWQSLGREGKQEMRDAGWRVEKVDGEWEVIVSPEDFQAWIINEVTELNNLLDFLRGVESPTQSVCPSYERTSLPTVKEMVRPALEVFADKKEHRRVEMINRLTEHFSLDDDERRYISKTGQVEKHLMNKGFIERTRTGYYRITTYGLEVVNDVPF